MDITLFYQKKKYLIQNLFFLEKLRKVPFRINHKKHPLPHRNNPSCFFFPQEGSSRFFKVVKLRNVIKKEQSQSLYQKVTFNTQNSLLKKRVSSELEYPGKSFRKSSVENLSLKVFSPLTGLVVNVLRKEGPVEKNEVIVVIDAMKMENKILAPKKGELSLAKIKAGMSLKTGDHLFTIS